MTFIPPTVTWSFPVKKVPVVTRKKDNTLTLAIDAPKGYYVLSVISDGSGFDWETLYTDMTLFKNQGERTGPWDFDIKNQCQPLVPAYWVSLNGQALGLWYFQRVSIQDMEHRVFRGHCAVHLPTDGPHALTLRPYQEHPLPWLQASFELKSDEQPAQDWVNLLGDAPAALPLDAWNDAVFWEKIQHDLQNDRAWLAPFLDVSLDWATQSKPHTSRFLPLMFKARLHHDDQALQQAVAIIDAAVALPHFGNPNPAGYGHNGDMIAAEQILTLSQALHLLPNEFAASRRKAIHKKIVLQSRQFVTAALINEDYWGGSVLQDHGWRSYFLFATALLHLPDIHQNHHDLLAFALGRIRKSIAAMPRDGVISWSSYGYPHLYLDAAAALRQTLLASTQIDLYDHGPWHEIVNFTSRASRAQGGVMLIRATNQDNPSLIGGLEFFLHMAQKYHDPRALRLAELIAQRPPSEHFYCSPQTISYYHTPLTGLTTPWPRFHAQDVEDARLKTRRIDYFPDSGLVRFHDPKADVTLTLRCAPNSGWHASRHATGPCDRMHVVPDDGHFALLQGTDSLLASSEHGYRLRSATRSCLLIDGQGQYGDIDYPMSLPDFQYPGQHISRISQDRVELDLTRAYPAARAVLSYKRSFLFLPSRVIHCVDTLTLRQPAQLDWLFHGRVDHKLSLRKLRFVVGTPARLTIDPQITSLEGPDGSTTLAAVIEPTPIVWSYDSCTRWAPLAAVRYSTRGKVTAASVRFVLRYGGPNR